MVTYRAVEVNAEGRLVPAERELRPPEPGQVRIKVEACEVCTQCRRGQFVRCTNQPVTGVSVDGGYAEYAYARPSGLVTVPEEADAIELAPLLCAGFTTFNTLMKFGLKPGRLVAVQGVGGLGHLGVQYARKLGLRVAAIARGQEKAGLATSLGADVYIDSRAEDPGPRWPPWAGRTRSWPPPPAGRR